MTVGAALVDGRSDRSTSIDEALLESIGGAGLRLEEPLVSDPAMQRLWSMAERLVEAGRSLDVRGEPGVGRRTLVAALGASMPGPSALLYLPPLRDRPQDVVGLFRAFLAQACAEVGRRVPEVSLATEASLVQHAFPGNLHELRLLALRAAVVSEKAVRPEALGLAPEASRPLRSTVRDAEREALLVALQGTGWNVSAAARALSLPRRTVIYRMSKLGLTRPPG